MQQNEKLEKRIFLKRRRRGGRSKTRGVFAFDIDTCS